MTPDVPKAPAETQESLVPPAVEVTPQTDQPVVETAVEAALPAPTPELLLAASVPPTTSEYSDAAAVETARKVSELAMGPQPTLPLPDGENPLLYNAAERAASEAAHAAAGTTIDTSWKDEASVAPYMKPAETVHMGGQAPDAQPSVTTPDVPTQENVSA
jgi:hypothetical protein